MNTHLLPPVTTIVIEATSDTELTQSIHDIEQKLGAIHQIPSCVETPLHPLT